MRVLALLLLLASTVTIRAADARYFRDCRNCPQMTAVPAGRFTMGTPALEAGRGAMEWPQHEVAIARPFAIAANPVTRAEYSRFVTATRRPDPPSCSLVEGGAFTNDPQRNWHNPGFAQTASDPVTCVSYEDISDYLAWLSKLTKKKYRLPSEAEWEYAARAGTRTPWWWGDAASHEFSNYGTESCCDALKLGRDQWDYSSPVTSFTANAFGLHDVGGNVFQWVQDCWHTHFDGAPTDGSAWDSPDCKDRVHRGSSWHGSAAFTRIGFRVHDPVGARNVYLGFRVARDL